MAAAPKEPAPGEMPQASNPGAASAPPAAPGKKAGRGKFIALIAVAAVACIAGAVWLRGGGPVEYWPKEPPDAAGVETAAWAFDMAEMGENETIVSVSPSGKHILTVERSGMDLEKRFASGVANMYGRQVKYLALYTEQNGSYLLSGRTELTPEANPALNDTLAICQEDGIAWNSSETQVLIGVGVDTKPYLREMHSDLYLFDVAKQTFENLTGRDDAPSRYRVFLPRWAGDNSIHYIRYDPDGNWAVSLMEGNVKTGEQEQLADLSDEGRAVFVAAYQVRGDTVYYSRENTEPDRSGFFAAKLGGGTAPAHLLSIRELREAAVHPYIQGFLSVEISPDGRWACLTANDGRINARDIPLADHPDLPQPDPASAVSTVQQGQRWVPCHNVILYDLEKGEMVDPLANAALRPDVVLATAATFAPDGKSLLCAVFGEGGPWTTEDFQETTLYQIRLEDESFDAVRILKTKVDTLPGRVTWLGNHTLLLRPAWSLPPLNPVTMVKPAAFQRFD